MKIFSYNCRGLARLDKKLALCHLLTYVSLDIIFLQETLGPTIDITQSLQNMLPGWTFVGLDAPGRSGGLALRYNTRSIKMLNHWGGAGHLGADIRSVDLGMNIKIFNVYGPCHNRYDLWQNLLGSDLFLDDHLILGGDLNFSIGHVESWGHEPNETPYWITSYPCWTPTI